MFYYYHHNSLSFLIRLTIVVNRLKVYVKTVEINCKIFTIEKDSQGKTKYG